MEEAEGVCKNALVKFTAAGQQKALKDQERYISQYLKNNIGTGTRSDRPLSLLFSAIPQGKVQNGQTVHPSNEY